MAGGSRIRKITRWVLFVLVCLFFVFFYGVVPWFLTGIATTSRFHFHDPNDGKTPKDFGMEFQTVEFHSTDGLLLKGWYVPAADPGVARGTIVYLHGHNRTRV